MQQHPIGQKESPGNTANTLLQNQTAPTMKSKFVFRCVFLIHNGKKRRNPNTHRMTGLRQEKDQRTFCVNGECLSEQPISIQLKLSENASRKSLLLKKWLSRNQRSSSLLSSSLLPFLLARNPNPPMPLPLQTSKTSHIIFQGCKHT